MKAISDRDHALVLRLMRELERLEGRDTKTLNQKREAKRLVRKFERQQARKNPKERKEQKQKTSTLRVAVGNDGQGTLFAQEP